MSPKPKNPMYVAFGQQLRAIRDKRGWTQGELAERIRARLVRQDPKATFTKSNIANYEGGFAVPSLKHFPVILEVLGCELVVGAETIQIVEKNIK